MVVVFIVATIVFIGLFAIPYIISYKVACEYAETLPEKDREAFWNDYCMELSNDQNWSI